MKGKYLLTIIPNELIVQRVADIKILLRKLIGVDYGSCNSMAHVSLIYFIIEDKYYHLVLEEFKRVLAGVKPFHIAFSGFDFIEKNGTLYIKITPNSIEEIVTSCRGVNKKFRATLKKVHCDIWDLRYNKPHMTIARELSDPLFFDALRSFKHFEDSCLCSQFMIRKLNEKTKQFDTIDSISLLGNPVIEGEQLLLF